MTLRGALAFVVAVAACSNPAPAGKTGGSGGDETGGASGGAGKPGTGGTPSGGGGGATPTGGTTGGAGTGGSGGGPAPDAGAPVAGMGGTGPVTPATCSDSGPAPMPVAGFMAAAPMDMRFPFSTHWMGVFSANPRCISMTSFSDIDNDGDQDFASGQRDVACSGSSNPNNPMVWWEYCGPDHWVKHQVGAGFKSAAAGGAGDFDGDGWVDLVVADSWFRNPGMGVRTAPMWTRYPTGAPGNTEEITVGDVTGDGKFEVLHVVNNIMPQWWAPGADPTKPWTRGAAFPYNQQQGGAIGDLDGDGRNDILVGDRWWYRAAPGEATAPWTPMPIPEATNFAPGGSMNGTAPITWLGDIDGDGDLDIVLQQHWGQRVAWFENGDGKGTKWTSHPIVGPGAPFEAKRLGILHGLFAFDFDNDGDLDVFSGENQGNLWIYENTDGKGTFAEHLVAIGPAHEARAADVDCDGDLDIAGKPWGDPGDGAAGRSETIRAHVYFKNELVERGGKPSFVRPKGEVWNVPNKGLCKR
jgi:hypothetical protein